jgi:micrococcal nuclease
MKNLLFLLSILSTSLFAGDIKGKVTAVYDGDTIIIVDSNKTRHEIRLQHIDAPESKQPFGQKAKKFLAKMLFGKKVLIRVKEKDTYGRSIGVVLINGKNANLEMLLNGFAWHYKFFSSDSKYASAQLKANKRKAGLWADKKPTPPWEYRKNTKKDEGLK